MDADEEQKDAEVERLKAGIEQIYNDTSYESESVVWPYRLLACIHKQCQELLRKGDIDGCG